MTFKGDIRNRFNLISEDFLLKAIEYIRFGFGIASIVHRPSLARDILCIVVNIEYHKPG